jgi:5-methylcytosine-specific restriction endonuclease McrA
MRRLTKDGRTILTGRDYQRLREAVYLRDRGRCVACGGLVSLVICDNDSDMHLAHVKARKMGGGSRDDTPENTMTKCRRCHMKEHNQS